MLFAKEAPEFSLCLSFGLTISLKTSGCFAVV